MNEKEILDSLEILVVDLTDLSLTGDRGNRRDKAVRNIKHVINLIVTNSLREDLDSMRSIQTDLENAIGDLREENQSLEKIDKALKKVDAVLDTLTTLLRFD